MRSTLLLLFIIVSSIVMAQPYYADTILDRNAVKANLTDRGILFNDTLNGYAGYEVPKNSFNFAIYAMSFWFGALDANNDLRLAAQKFNVGDYYAGPYSSNSAYSSQFYQDKYSPAIWNVSKQQVEAHMMEYSLNAFVANPDPVILNWPANGDTFIGVADDLAPYVDVNNDGIYDPYAGDYPDIKGCETTYIIFNDDAGPHTQSGGEKLGIEVHLMLYQYATNNYLDTTTFIDMRVVNRGNNVLNDFRTAIYMDADIGNNQDDFTGCDTLRNLMYTYNGDAVDETNGGNLGYGVDAPCLAIKCLNDSMENFGYYTGLGGFGYPYTDPGGAVEYWNYMNGLWQDGSPWYYGGAGFTGSPGSTTTQTTYMFSGYPELGTGWSEVTNNNFPGDRRTFMTVQDAVMLPGDERQIDYVILTAFGGDHLTSVARMRELADSAQVFYDNFNDFCDDVLALDEHQDEVIAFELYPNPSNGSFNVSLPEGLNQAKIVITDLAGKIVYSEQAIDGKQITLNSSAGVYLVSIVNNEFSSTKKLVIE